MTFSQDVLEIVPLPWQRWLLIHALELRPDGAFRFRTILVLVARQNGKTSVVEIKNLWKMFVLRVPLVICTAQSLDTAEESWDKAVEIVESIPELDAEKAQVDKTNGKKALKLTNGSRWKIAAASRRGGRGLSGDDVNLDELREHLTWDSWGAVTKTTMARAKAQIWAYSNAGDNRSIVLNDLQQKGRAAVLAPGGNLGHFEWSAPDDTKCTCPNRSEDQPHGAACQLRDPVRRAQANPAYGYTITTEALDSALETDPEPVFLTECLCVRVPDLRGQAIDPRQWADLKDEKSHRVGDVAIAVDITPERDYAAIGLYGLNSGDVGHVQLLDYRPGTDWIVGRLVELKNIDPIAIAMGKGTFKSLKTELELVGITEPEKKDEPERGDILVVAGADMAAACGQLIDAVRQGTVRHQGQEQLDDSVEKSRTRQTADAVAWSRDAADGDITPLVTITEARYAFTTWSHLVLSDYDVLDSVY